MCRHVAPGSLEGGSRTQREVCLENEVSMGSIDRWLSEDRDVMPIVFTVGVVNFLVGFALAVLLQHRIVVPLPSLRGGCSDRTAISDASVQTPDRPGGTDEKGGRSGAEANEMR